MSSLVLIHGGAHGPWCWERLLPYIEAADVVDSILAIDLIEDALAAAAIERDDITIDHYVEGVVRKLEDLDLRDVVLVGHSMAGITIPGVAHRVPERIGRIIYLTTSNPVAGQSIENLMEHPLSPLSRGASFEEMFCNDLDDASKEWLLSNLRSDPPKIFSEPVRHCTLPAGIHSTYVLFEKDLALPPEFQLEQAENARVDEIRRFDAGHSGYLSKPAELARLLLEYVSG